MAKQEININNLNELKTKTGKAFYCTFSVFSKIHLGKIMQLRGRVEGGQQEYWWDAQGQCTTRRPNSPNSVRHPEYDLDYSQLNGEETKQ